MAEAAETVKVDENPAASAEKSSTNTDQIPMPSMQKARYDWYQNETDVVVNVLLKNVKHDQCNVNFDEHNLSVTIKLDTGNDYSLEIDFAHPIVPSKSVCRVLGTKVEIRMRKAEGFHWTTLEGDGKPPMVKQVTEPVVEATKKITQNYPTSSTRGPKNWDAIEREVLEEEEKESLEGDAAVNKMFQKIYKDAPDDVKKAMVKSYTESGGTCLSTDWKDVSKKPLKVKPPDGMEFKKW